MFVNIVLLTGSKILIEEPVCLSELKFQNGPTESGKTPSAAGGIIPLLQCQTEYKGESGHSSLSASQLRGLCDQLHATPFFLCHDGLYS